MATAPHWDADSPELTTNLTRVLQAVKTHAQARSTLTAADVLGWHADMMLGLAIPEAVGVGLQEDDLRGAFRGPPKLDDIEVEIGGTLGTAAAQVASEVDQLLQRVQTAIAALDSALQGRGPQAYAPGELQAVCQLAAMLHGEWVRIHPFGNGNGRSARLLTNWVLMRYGILPVLSPRPRPGGGYEAASMQGMQGRHDAMVRLLLKEVAALYPTP